MNRLVHPFDEYVRQNDSEIRVVHAALLFALDRFPELCVPTYLRRVDSLAQRVDSSRAIKACERVAALRKVLVDEEGLVGRSADYCDPCGSYVNCVLDHRHGLPISLSVLWLDVARQLGWPFYGVGMPGHFLLGCDLGPSEPCYIDPFGGGAVLDRAGCARLLARCFGRELALADSHLVPVGERAILSRMLGNLRAVYCASQQWRHLEGVLQRLRALHPDNAELCEEVGRVRRLVCEQN